MNFLVTVIIMLATTMFGARTLSHTTLLNAFLQLQFATVRHHVLRLLHWQAGPSPGKPSLVCACLRLIILYTLCQLYYNKMGLFLKKKGVHLNTQNESIIAECEIIYKYLLQIKEMGLSHKSKVWNLPSIPKFKQPLSYFL